jgi:hypothetical protein
MRGLLFFYAKVAGSGCPAHAIVVAADNAGRPITCLSVLSAGESDLLKHGWHLSKFLGGT